MNLASPIRKIFQGTADRHQMYRLFDRHAQRPSRGEDDARPLYAGEWFEIYEADYDRMLDIMPPLWMRGDMFALREFLTGSVTSVFFTLKIDGRIRWFHGYCELSDCASPEHMRIAIIERESWPEKAMTRTERLEHIWSITHDDYRGFAGDSWPQRDRGKRTVLFCGSRLRQSLKLLEDLTGAEIFAKLPVHLRYLPEPIAA